MTHQQKTINGMVKEKLFEDSHIDIFGDLTKSIEEYIFLTIRDNKKMWKCEQKKLTSAFCLQRF